MKLSDLPEVNTLIENYKEAKKEYQKLISFSIRVKYVHLDDSGYFTVPNEINNDILNVLRAHYESIMAHIIDKLTAFGIEIDVDNV